VDLGRIVDVWVDTTLEDIFEFLRFGVSSLGQPGEMNVQEGRTGISTVVTSNSHVTEVEETNVPKIDRFLMKHLL
jgi:hypothetical protein